MRAKKNSSQSNSRNGRKTSRSEQLKFESAETRSELRFGGSLMKKAMGRTARPISSKDPMHLVLRSSKAKGIFGFGHHFNIKRVNEIVKRHCEKYGVKLIEYSNNYNHLHLLVRFPSRAIYMRFIRSLTGHLAIAVTGANRFRSISTILENSRTGSKAFSGAKHGSNASNGQVHSSDASAGDKKNSEGPTAENNTAGASTSKGFWDFRPFTRVVRSYRGYKIARDYVVLNQLEAMVVLPKRAGRLKDVEPGERHYFRRCSAP